jgi:hypothetical protein
MNRIRDAKDPNERMVNIRRAGRIDEKDQKTIIPVLVDIMKRSPNYAERQAAASALIQIGTEEALKPVTFALFFRMDRMLNMGIINEMKRKNTTGYRDELASWGEDVLNDPLAMKKYEFDQIISALNMFIMFNENGLSYVDPEFYMDDAQPRIMFKAYEMMKSYPPDRIPVSFLRDRMEERFRLQAVSVKEFEKFYGLVSRKKIPRDKTAFEIDSAAVQWGLGSSDYEIRELTVKALGLCWTELDDEAQPDLLSRLEEISETDDMYIEGSYPVREAAELVLEEVRNL